MKLLVLIGSVFAVALAQSNLRDDDYAGCQQDPIPIFKNDVLLPFTARVASEASYYSKGHFIISAHTMWLSLASVAESADHSSEGGINGLWDSLYFPSQKCVRDQIYQLALSLESPSAEFLRHRALAIDNTLKVKEEWIAFSNSSGILQYLPVNYNDEPFGRVQEYMGIEPKIPLSGHSVFLDRLDWGSLWTSALIDDTVTLAPFYSDEGEEIAQVEYLRMKTRARVTDIPEYNVRVLELPVGSDGRYSMVLAVGGEAKTMIEAVFSRDILSELNLTEEPVDVVIPRLTMSSGMDLRSVISNIGLSSIFKNEDITSYISEPSASPMGYFQRVDINITGSWGRKEDSEERLLDLLQEIDDSIVEYLFRFDISAPEEHYHFIANKPFLFSLFETNIGVPVFTGVYSYPGKRGQQEISELNVIEKIF